MKSTKIFICCPADLVFAPTLAFTRFSEDLLLRYAMITAASCSAAYVDPFARTWPGFSTTDPDSSYILYGFVRIGKWQFAAGGAAVASTGCAGAEELPKLRKL